MFTFVSFSVSASQIPSNVGAAYVQTQPIQTMSWDGTQPTQFTRASGALTNGSNFDRADGTFFYTLGAGTPPVGLLFRYPSENLLLESALTVAPLSNVTVTAAPALTPAAAAATAVLLVLVAFLSLRRTFDRPVSAVDRN